MKLVKANEADNRPTNMIRFQNNGVATPLFRCIIIEPKLQMANRIM